MPSPVPAEDQTTSPPASRKGITHTARKVVIATVGGTVTVTGLILMPLPGPGTPIVIAGLAILATEFDAAQRQLDRITNSIRRIMRRH